MENRFFFFFSRRLVRISFVRFKSAAADECILNVYLWSEVFGDLGLDAHTRKKRVVFWNKR